MSHPPIAPSTELTLMGEFPLGLRLVRYASRPDGQFRVQVGSDCEWLEDFPPPASREGRKLLGRDWRPCKAPPVKTAHTVVLDAPNGRMHNPSPEPPMPARRSTRLVPGSDLAPPSNSEHSRSEKALRCRGDDEPPAVGAATSARQLGRSLVGSRVSVWWEDDCKWYDGAVRDFCDALGEHLICYDDGEQQQEMLDECRRVPKPQTVTSLRPAFPMH